MQLDDETKQLALRVSRRDLLEEPPPISMLDSKPALNSFIRKLDGGETENFERAKTPPRRRGMSTHPGCAVAKSGVTALFGASKRSTHAVIVLYEVRLSAIQLAKACFAGAS